MKKSVTILLTAYLSHGVSAATNYLNNPDFTQGVGGLSGWEAFYNAEGVGTLAPSNFVSVSSGVATVRGFGGVPNGEKALYQTFTVAGGAMPSGTYQWSAMITNLTDPAAEMFIKVWERDNDWGAFVGPKYQHPVLSNGLMILTYEHASTNLVQFGFHCYTTNVLEGFDLSAPTLTLLAGAPATVTQALVVAVGAAPGVSFLSESGVSYSLESTPELAALPVSWQLLETKTGTGGLLVLGTNAPILERRLFRVVTP